MVPSTGYYCVAYELADPQTGQAEYSYSNEYYGINKDQFDPGLALILVGIAFGIIDLSWSRVVSKKKTRE